MKLPLAYYGDPILRKKADPITEITEEIKQLVLDMEDTMNANNGIGIAAPQVHHSIRLFITCLPVKGMGEDEWIPGPLRVFINPVIESLGEETCVISEGCLSIPKIHRDVERPAKVVVRATDLNGAEFTLEACELEAHLILHENDHINGVLFIDRIHGKERKKIENQLRDIKTKYASKKR
jgi:peptide deformylase